MRSDALVSGVVRAGGLGALNMWRKMSLEPYHALSVQDSNGHEHYTTCQLVILIANQYQLRLEGIYI